MKTKVKGLTSKDPIDKSRSKGQKDVGRKANMHCRWESMGKKEAVILQKNNVVVKLWDKSNQ